MNYSSFQKGHICIFFSHCSLKCIAFIWSRPPGFVSDSAFIGCDFYVSTGSQAFLRPFVPLELLSWYFCCGSSKNIPTGVHLPKSGCCSIERLENRAIRAMKAGQTICNGQCKSIPTMDDLCFLIYPWAVCACLWCSFYELAFGWVILTRHV